MDILFTKDDQKFSYRVSGLALKDGRLLVQHVPGDDGYALPGGHVAFGETSAQTLAREFQEELQLNLTVGQLAAVGEVFWDWHGFCQQLGLYYWVELEAGPWEGVRHSAEGSDIEFCWIPLEEFTSGRLTLYPEELAQCLCRDGRISHFISKQL